MVGGSAEGGASATVVADRTQYGSDACLRRGGIVDVARVEQRDDGSGADAIKACPLALHQRLLHIAPVLDVCGGSFRRWQGGRIGQG